MDDDDAVILQLAIRSIYISLSPWQASVTGTKIDQRILFLLFVIMRRQKNSPKKRHTKHTAREPVVVSANEHSVEAILRTSPPVGVNYYAISPEETFTSAHELNEVTFERIFDVVTVEDFEHWFPNDSVRGAQQNPLPIWSSMLSDNVAAATSEGLMNATIQRSLVENISNVGGLTINADNAKTNPGMVNEKQLWSLINTAYGEEEPHKVHANGLPISLQSKPDFAIWSKSNTVLLIGEGKNQRKYDFFACRRQAAAYMLAHLFHWIVPKSKAVEGVYGVAFCGPNCTGMETVVPYKAALLRLSLFPSMRAASFSCSSLSFQKPTMTISTCCGSLQTRSVKSTLETPTTFKKNVRRGCCYPGRLFA